MTPSNVVVPVVLVSVYAWRMYSRVRRSIGRQPVQPKRLVARIIILAVVACLIAFASVNYPQVLLGLGGGLALGVALAFLGLSLTVFEATPEGRFYTPNRYIGLALTVLFAGRILYRLFVISTISDDPSQVQAPAVMRSPLSLMVFGLVAGYYMAYYTSVFVRSRATAPA